MKIVGSATLHAPRQRVWAALHDPAVLVATIPGCRRLDQTGTDSYRVTVDAGVGSLTGTYLGSVALTEARPPDSFILRGRALGGPGTVAAAVTVTLTPGDGDGGGDATTRLNYVADAEVGGVIAGVGQRLLAGVAKKTAQEFFDAVDAALTGRIPVGVAAGSGAHGGQDAQGGTERAGQAGSGDSGSTATTPRAPAAAEPAPAPGPAPGPLGDVPGAATAWVAPSAPGVEVRQGGAVWAVVTAAWSGGAIALAGVLLGWLIGRAGRRA